MIDRPTLEPLLFMPESDLIREGGVCDTVCEFVNTYFGGDIYQEVAVVRL
ncbi:hypothetical protein [Phormidium sp. FACHB-1136]|nr:hypothetical protein [Phormidium sp. FACHB-1136]MBD2425141.1 hypothetical protein [Phormidium sp. FACHB-1136]